MCKNISKSDEPQLPEILCWNLSLDTWIKWGVSLNVWWLKILATTKSDDTKDLNTKSIVSKNTSQHRYGADYVPFF